MPPDTCTIFRVFQKAGRRGGSWVEGGGGGGRDQGPHRQLDPAHERPAVLRGPVALSAVGGRGHGHRGDHRIA